MHHCAVGGLSVLLLACSESASTPPRDAGEPLGTNGSFAGMSGSLDLPQATPDASMQPVSPVPLPSDFIETELGGYRLGPALSAIDAPIAAAPPRDVAHCNTLTAVVRDFRGARDVGGHPDFEIFSGKKPTLGLVGPELDAAHKPQYASRCEADHDKASCPYGQMTTDAAHFAQWYRNTDGVNSSYLLELGFAANGGVYTFESKNFFPLDDAGFGNSGGKRKHNFSFTTEVHTRFRYRGGEVFSFTGDDDLWVFINGKLAIDLGGLHPPAAGMVDLDSAATTLGLDLDQEYSLDLFHAERHSANSNFRVDTTIEFTECGRTDPELL